MRPAQSVRPGPPRPRHEFETRGPQGGPSEGVVLPVVPPTRLIQDVPLPVLLTPTRVHGVTVKEVTQVTPIRAPGLPPVTEVTTGLGPDVITTTVLPVSGAIHNGRTWDLW